MASVSGLRPHHRLASARRAGLIGAALAALTLAGCATPNGDGSWNVADEDAGPEGYRYVPLTVAGVADGLRSPRPPREAVEAARFSLLLINSATEEHFPGGGGHALHVRPAAEGVTTSDI